MMEIRQITSQRRDDANIPNQPFLLWGRMIPSLCDGVWDHRVEESEKASEMCFPDYPYDPDTYDGVILGAYEGDTCIGVAALRNSMFRYLYLEDLKVNRDRRGQGIGGMLVEACVREAARRGMKGVYTVGQDNNLSACLFYLHHGFAIGGFDNRAYDGTSQEGKADIFFYRDC